jgi:hypothetical protein
MAFRLDPRDLIAGPFVRCPNCGEEQFGIHIVGGRSYQRRCRNCWHGARFALPDLSRKVLYVDQFVISNMMKALDGTHPRHQATAADPLWRTLFERLDRLVKLQVVICPPSDVHRSESLVTAYYQCRSGSARLMRARGCSRITRATNSSRIWMNWKRRPTRRCSRARESSMASRNLT